MAKMAYSWGDESGDTGELMLHFPWPRARRIDDNAAPIMAQLLRLHRPDLVFERIARLEDDDACAILLRLRHNLSIPPITVADWGHFALLLMDAGNVATEPALPDWPFGDLPDEADTQPADITEWPTMLIPRWRRPDQKGA